METKRLKRIVLQFGVVLLLMVMVFPSAFAATKGTNPAQLKIISVKVNADLKSLEIVGVNFTKAKGAPVISLGSTILVTDINSTTDTTLTANSLADFTPGDYRLTVTTGNGATEYDEYDLTIPAKGGGSGTIDPTALRATLQFKQCDGVNTCSCDGQKVVMTYGVKCSQPGTYNTLLLETSGGYTEPILADPTSVYGGITGINAYCWYNWGAGVPKYYTSDPPEKIWLMCF